MNNTAEWLKRRQFTIGLAIFFVLWYIGELVVYHRIGDEFARWLFYFDLPPNALSPGILLGPVSHHFTDLTHIGSNTLFLLVAGGVAEPYIEKKKILLLVFGMGYLGTYIANVTAIFHGLWVIAGASGGILALWAYAGLRLRFLAADGFSSEVSSTTKIIESVAAAGLLGCIPLFLLHQLIWVSQPHMGHALGIVLGCLVYAVEVIKEANVSDTAVIHSEPKDPQ